MNFNEMMIRLLLIIPALTIHEMAHGLASYLLGDHTAKRDGRISLNPLRHIDPIGLLFIIVTRFGWAKPVMTDPRYFKNPKIGMAITALAGPVSNFILAFLTMLVYVPLVFVVQGNQESVFSDFLYQFYYLNLSLGVFNLLPIPPLDGSKVFSVFLPDDLYWRFTGMQYGFFLVIILLMTEKTQELMIWIISVLSSGIFIIMEKIYSFIL